MLFTDPLFFPFFAATMALYYLPPLRRLQVAILILASLVFYAYDQPWLLLLLVASATLSGGTSYLVLGSGGAVERRAWAAAGVAANLAVLGFFKYSGLLYRSLGGAVPTDGIGHFLVALPLPIGISFYTFHGISLLVDVFRRGDAVVAAHERADGLAAHLRNTVLYLTFFPQLIAGPIVKAHQFYPQIRPKSLAGIDWPAAVRALILGYFLKCFVADNLQGQTFLLAYPGFLGQSSLNLLILLFGYSMRIFADFAGYSLIAVGLARLLGYELPQNFNFPYIAETFSEFWTRWNMSLSSWLREYLYISLGGNRKGSARTYANLMSVMVLGGLWHGAAWSYALWGSWHGMALVVERLARGTRFYRSPHILLRAVRMAMVFAFVTCAWLFFQMPRVGDVGAFLQAMPENRHLPFQPGPALVVLIYSLPVVAYHAAYLWRRDGAPGTMLGATLSTRLERLAYGALMMATLLSAGPRNAFIYFQF